MGLAGINFSLKFKKGLSKKKSFLYKKDTPKIRGMIKFRYEQSKEREGNV